MDGMIVHTPGSHRVSLDELRRIPTPEPMGPRHQPVAHAELVDHFLDGFNERGWRVEKQQFAVSAMGAKLIGMFDLNGPQTVNGMVPRFAFRSSFNQTFAIKAVAGTRVVICDNGLLSGEEFVLAHKSTIRLDIHAVVEEGLHRFELKNERLAFDIEVMGRAECTDSLAKNVIFDFFHAGAAPLRLFPKVATNYLNPPDEYPDCQPRTLMGLHNAFTRAFKELKPERQFTATRELGARFGIGR